MNFPSSSKTSACAMRSPRSTGRAGVTRYPHSEAGWTVSFKPKDQDDRKRIAEVFGNRRYYLDVLKSLDAERHQFVMKRELTGEVCISSLPATRPHLIKRENSPR